MGAKLGAFAGSICPGVGNIVGAIVGFVAGFCFSILFDWFLNIKIYDGKNIKDITKDFAKDVWKVIKNRCMKKQ